MDLREYVSTLPATDAAWLASELSTRLAALASAAEDEAAASAATDGRASLEAQVVLRRRVCALQLQEELAAAALDPPPDCAAPGATPEAAAGGSGDGDGMRCPHEARASELAELFADALPLSKGLDERERGPADELLPLAAAALMRAAAVRGGRADTGPRLVPLLRAAAVLEAGAVGRPFSADCRLGLTALYGLLGAPSAAAAHFAKTDAKHIQLDTLASHHLLPVALGLGADRVTGPLLAATRALFEDHGRDAGDTLMQAYNHDTHTKVGCLGCRRALPCTRTPVRCACVRPCLFREGCGHNRDRRGDRNVAQLHEPNHLVGAGIRVVQRAPGACPLLRPGACRGGDPLPATAAVQQQQRGRQRQRRRQWRRRSTQPRCSQPSLAAGRPSGCSGCSSGCSATVAAGSAGLGGDAVQRRPADTAAMAPTGSLRAAPRAAVVVGGQGWRRRRRKVSGHS
jgi:hypothetical protein